MLRIENTGWPGLNVSFRVPADFFTTPRKVSIYRTRNMPSLTLRSHPLAFLRDDLRRKRFVACPHGREARGQLPEPDSPAAMRLPDAPCLGTEDHHLEALVIET
jgi:hypothetical protein